jgi:hypothetical protein
MVQAVPDLLFSRLTVFWALTSVLYSCFNSEIVVEQNPDDVSTLGDPVNYQNGGMALMNQMERDEQTAR